MLGRSRIVYGRLLLLCLALTCAACGPAETDVAIRGAGEPHRVLRVVTSGGFAAAYDVLAPAFEAQDGIELVTERGASSGGADDSIPVRLARGEKFDVVILSRPSLDELTTRGLLRAGTDTDLARSSIGMAVRAGAPIPDISTPERFTDVLLTAKSIGYSASASGTYLSTVLFPKIGLWDEIEPKSKRIVSERVGAVVARGDVEVGFQQISEILPIHGAVLAGPIPSEYQRVETFSAGITSSSENMADAEQLIEYLSSGAVASTIESTGLEPIANVSAEYPNRPVTFVVAFGVGGSADRMTRTMSTFIADALGQPVRVVNREGAGTLLAANYILERPHDGYTVFASGFSPYLSNTILEGNADYTVDDFAYLNFQWFDEDLIALNKDTKYSSLPELLEDIRAHPKTVRASVVRGSGGHLMAKLLLEKAGIPQENLNLVTYNGGGPARAAVAGGVVDFIVISAPGTESIREYLRPLAIFSHERNPEWDVPTLNEALAPAGIVMPILPGSIRGFATSAEFKRQYPERFETLALAIRKALENPELIDLLDRASIGRRWIGPDASEKTMRETFQIFKDYSYLLEN